MGILCKPLQENEYAHNEIMHPGAHTVDDLDLRRME